MTQPEIWRQFPRGPVASRQCIACAVPIAFTESRVPLDLTTLRLRIEPSGKVDGWEARSHFQTCTDPARFSGRRS